MKHGRIWPAVAAVTAGLGLIGLPGPAAQAGCSAAPAAYVTTEGSGTISVINGCDKVRATINLGSSAAGIVIAPGTSTGYVVSLTEGTVSAFSTNTDAITATFAVASHPDGFPIGIAVSPVDHRLYTANNGDHTLSVVNTQTDRLIDTIPLSDAPLGLALSPDGDRLYVGDNSQLVILDTATDTIVATLKVPAASVAVSPDGQTVYAESPLDSVAVLDAATDAVEATIPDLESFIQGDVTPTDLALSPDGGRLYEDDPGAGTLKVDDTAAATPVGTIRVGKEPNGVALSASGSLAYVPDGGQNTTSVVSTGTGKVVATIPAGDLPYSVAATPALPGSARIAWSRGVSCLASGYCMAVGSELARAGTDPLAEQRSHGTWTVTAPAALPLSSDDTLNQVSCVTQSDCLAVGTADVLPIPVTGPLPVAPVALAEKWNGHQWTAVQAPEPSGTKGAVLRSVSCASASSCLAVGSYASAGGVTSPLSDRWNGKSWQLARVPDPAHAQSGTLTAVSCQRSACTAAGTYTVAGQQRPLSETWNGKSWHAVPMASPGRYSGLAVRGVACSSPGSCLAVGDTVPPYKDPSTVRLTATPFTERLAGGRWHLLARAAKTPANSMLDAISCPAASSCVAVGTVNEARQQSALAEVWDGKQWRIHSPGTASPTLSILNSVSCPHRQACLAVGNDGPSVLAELWNGTGWRKLSPPTP